MSSRRPQLSLYELIDIGLAAVQIIPIAIKALLTAPFRGNSSNRDLITQVSFVASKAWSRRASARQLQWLNPPTDEVYLTFAQRKQFAPASTSLPNAAKAHWIGREEDAAKILVFFHGGGFVKPLTTQLGLLWDIKQSIAPQKLAICVLSYVLAPEAQYPVQLQQAVDLIRHLVIVRGRKPEDLIVCGDSAGGNLVLALLSHMLHPHKSIAPLDLSGPILGAALVAPWGEFRTNATSYTRNAAKDSIDAPVLQKWSAYYMGGAKADNYNQPFRAVAGWWKDLHGVVQNVIVTAGTDEVLLDDIQAFADTLKEVLPSATLLVTGVGEVHDQPFIEPLTDDKRSEQARLLKAWIAARIQGSG